MCQSREQGRDRAEIGPRTGSETGRFKDLELGFSDLLCIFTRNRYGLAMATKTPKIQANRQLLFHTVALVLIIGLMKLLGVSLTPFVIGAILAYFLHPVATYLEKHGWRRRYGAFFLTFATFAVLFVLLRYALPSLFTQVTAFIDQLPELINNMRGHLDYMFNDSTEDFLKRALPTGDALTKLIDENFKDKFQGDFTKFLKASSTIFNILMLLLITPFVTFYFLKDWKRVVQKANSLLPRKSAKDIRKAVLKINQDVNGFLRGQSLIALIQASIHAVGLWAIGLNFGIWVGILTGLASFVPVVGNLVMFVVALTLAALQFSDMSPILMLVGLYGASQVLETAVLSPNIIGKEIGVNPLWIILSLLAFGNLFGLPGALLAIPLAITFKSVGVYFLSLYKESDYYKKY